jgi:hypothetical protein
MDKRTHVKGLLVGLAVLMCLPAAALAQNPDTAWLSQDPSGYPKLTYLEAYIDSSADFQMLLKNASDSAHSIMYPLYYDASEIQLTDFHFDTSIFPVPAAWSLFELDSIVGDSGKFMLYAWTSAYTLGVAPGVHRVGEFSILVLDSASTGIDTCLFPPQGKLSFSHGPSANDYFPDWEFCQLELLFNNPDTAWLSLDPSGLPILTEVDFMGSESKTFHVMLRNDSSIAHAIQYPLCYDTSALSLTDMEFDTTTFPTHAAWSFFERDTVHDGMGKLMFYAWTSVPAFGMPTGLNRIGTFDMEGVAPDSDSVVTVVDTCFYPPAGHLYYTNGVTAEDMYPDWFPVQVTVFSCMCGDVNGDGGVTTADGFTTLNYFGAGPAPVSCWAANVNGDGNLTTADGFHLLNWFGAGPDLTCAPCDL